MKFLWPMAGWLLAFALPIILLYLIRQRPRQRPVSTLLFWQQLAPKIHSLPLWRRMRRLISLLLQLLLLALLVFALVHPLLPGQSTVTSSLVLLLDPSVTMETGTGPQTRWQSAIKLARAQIDQMRFGDEATVVLAQDPPTVLLPWTGRKGDLRRVVNAARPGKTVTDIRPALRLARNLMLGRRDARIELISDTVWSVPPESDDLRQVKLDLVGGAGIPNSGITLFSARELSIGAGEYQLAIKLEQNTARPMQGELSILRNGQLMDESAVTIPPGEPWQKFWRGQGTDAIDFSAAWKPQNADSFALDQQAAAHLEPVREVRALLVSPENAFLETVLASQPLVKVQRLPPGAKNYPAADLVIFNETLPPAGWAGKNVVLIDPPQSGFWGERQGAIDRPLVSEFEKDAPLLRFTNLSDIEFRRATEFKPAPGAHVYVESFGKPLVFGHWEAEPRWLVLAFDLNQSDFVFRTSFPILCANLLQALRPDDPVAPDNVPGPVATQLKPMVIQPAGAAGTTSLAFAAWWLAVPFWWWFGCAALLLLLTEWSLYTRRITE